MIKHHEKLLITKLRNNSRKKINNISKEINRPQTTIYDALHRLEKNKIIKHVTKIDFEKIGKMFQTIIIIKIVDNFILENSLQKKIFSSKEVSNYLCELNNINCVKRIENDNTFFIEGIFKNQKEMSEFLEELHQKINFQEIKLFTILENIIEDKFGSQITDFE